jgi:hypothetical protein
MALARHHRSDALAKFAHGRGWIEQQRDAGGAHHIDETRRYHPSVNRNSAAWRSSQISDCRDAIASDSYIAAVPRIAHAVDNPGVLKDQIEFLRRTNREAGDSQYESYQERSNHHGSD